MDRKKESKDMQKLFSSSEQSPQPENRPEKGEKKMDRESTILSALLIVLFILLLAVSAMLWMSTESSTAPTAMRLAGWQIG